MFFEFKIFLIVTLILAIISIANDLIDNKYLTIIEMILTGSWVIYLLALILL